MASNLFPFRIWLTFEDSKSDLILSESFSEPHLKSLVVAIIVAFEDSGTYNVILPTPELNSLLFLPSGVSSAVILPAPVFASIEPLIFCQINISCT